METKTRNYGGSIVVSIFFLMMILAHLAFGETQRGLFFDLDGTIHKGFSDDYRGTAGDFGIGYEYRYVFPDSFAIGMMVKTSLGYDNYMVDTDTSHRFSYVDEYFLWQGYIGPVFYIGNDWYISGHVSMIWSVIGHDTYISGPDGDQKLGKKYPFDYDDFNYVAETGLRLSKHGLIYMRVTTTVIHSTIYHAKYSLYCGLRIYL